MYKDFSHDVIKPTNLDKKYKNKLQSIVEAYLEERGIDSALTDFNWELNVDFPEYRIYDANCYNPSVISIGKGDMVYTTKQEIF